MQTCTCPALVQKLMVPSQRDFKAEELKQGTEALPKSEAKGWGAIQLGPNQQVVSSSWQCQTGRLLPSLGDESVTAGNEEVGTASCLKSCL